MPIIKNLQSNNFLKIDRSAFRELSRNAISVYLAFVDTYQDVDPKNEIMCKKAKMSESTYKKYKKELIEKGYLVVVRTGAKNGIINYYFGKNAVKKYKKQLANKSP